MSRLIVLGLVLALGSASSAAAQTIVSVPRSGAMVFHDWEFSWNVGSDKEGLELSDVRFKGVRLLHKASMPVVRVKYRGEEEEVTDGCGPYEDRLHWGNMEVVNGATSKVIMRFFTDKLEIAVFSEIGGYDLFQAYYFHRDGRLQPMLYSSGWSCDRNPKRVRDHRHHPYWRLDFDVESDGDNQIREFRRASGSSSHVATLYTQERNAVKQLADADLFWTVGRAGSERHAVIRYASNGRRDSSGPAWFAFSSKDMGARRYKGSEDDGWPFGELGHLGFRSPSENIDGRDVVFWAVGHMTHLWTQADANDPQWHSSGPVIRAVW